MKIPMNVKENGKKNEKRERKENVNEKNKKAIGNMSEKNPLN